MLVQLRSKRPSVDGLLGRHIDPKDVLLRVEGDATIFKPDGSRLLTLRRAAVSEDAASAAYPFMNWLKKRVTHNRGYYAGKVNADTTTVKRAKKDGTIGWTKEGNTVHSVLVGSLDRYKRTPFCRPCAASVEKPEEWAACFPYVREVAEVFRSAVPDRYEAQMAAARATYPDYVISGTPFTTLTVNNTVSGACHRDTGDYEPGFGVMSVLRRGSYRGCELVFPAYGVAVDMQDRDVILFDPHEVHGNTPFFDAVGPEGDPDHGGYQRISMVYYYRTCMRDCLSPEKERERAKMLRGSLAADEVDE